MVEIPYTFRASMGECTVSIAGVLFMQSAAPSIAKMIGYGFSSLRKAERMLRLPFL